MQTVPSAIILQDNWELRILVHLRLLFLYTLNNPNDHKP